MSLFERLAGTILSSFMVAGPVGGPTLTASGGGLTIASGVGSNANIALTPDGTGAITGSVGATGSGIAFTSVGAPISGSLANGGAVLSYTITTSLATLSAATGGNAGSLQIAGATGTLTAATTGTGQTILQSGNKLALSSTGASGMTLDTSGGAGPITLTSAAGGISVTAGTSSMTVANNGAVAATAGTSSMTIANNGNASLTAVDVNTTASGNASLTAVDVTTTASGPAALTATDVSNTATTGSVTDHAGGSTLSVGPTGTITGTAGTSTFSAIKNGNISLNVAGGGGSSLTMNAATGAQTLNAGSGTITLTSSTATTGVTVTNDLTVSGKLTATGATSNVWRIAGNDVTGGTLGTSTNHPFTLITNNTTVLTFGTSGDITTTAPTANVVSLIVNGSTSNGNADIVDINGTQGTGILLNCAHNGAGITAKFLNNTGGSDCVLVTTNSGVGVHVTKTGGSGAAIHCTSPANNGSPGVACEMQNAHAGSFVNNSGNGIPALTCTAQATTDPTLEVIGNGDNTAAITVAAGNGTTATYTTFSTVGGVQKGSITFDGTHTLYNNTSDRRAKTDFKPSKLGVKDILRLKVLSYRVKDDPKKKIVHGFVAQDVIAAGFGQAVNVPKDPKAMMGLDERKLVPALWAAVRELAIRLERVEAQ